jgi:PIN domain nuclease of toxin-antitoxin system
MEMLNDLPFHHCDPFDRMLICQGLANTFLLMTDDEKINYSSQVL